MLEDIVQYCIDSWGTDDRTNNLLQKTTEWLQKVKAEDHEVYLKLLNNFKYYSVNKVQEVLAHVQSRLESEVNNIENTLYLPLINEKGVHNHSYDIRSLYQSVSSINKLCFPTEMNKVIKDYPLSEIENIVFLDDMTGSGNTIKNSILYMYNNYKEIFIEKNIYLIVLEACREGIEKILELKEEINLNIEIIYWNLHEKAFETGYIFNSEEIEIVRNVVLEYEKKIAFKQPQFILGFEQAEALMAFYYDTPNNTISSFWLCNDKIGWKPLFPRKRNKNYPWTKKINNNKKTRNNINYAIAKELNRKA